MKAAIVGIGLIGGSLALALKEKGIASYVIGVDANPDHQKKALQLGLVDEILDLESAVKASDLIILATPVNACNAIAASCFKSGRSAGDNGCRLYKRRHSRKNKGPS